MQTPPPAIRVSDEVRTAVDEGRPVLALESTILTHGLPRPRNLEVGLASEQQVRDAGVLPATIGVVDGMPVVGLSAAEIERLCTAGGVVKVSVRDLPIARAKGLDGGTTVAATAWLAHRAGIRVMSTGGLGGVHRGASETFDESADLGTLATTPITVVCAGVKSILDVGATLERLETLNVTVVGYGTDAFPGFYLADSGHPVPWRVDTPEEAAAVVRARAALGGDAGIVVANPLPVSEQLDPGLHARVLEDGLAAAERSGATGKDATPFLLDFFHRETAGASLEVNVRIVLRNAELAARIAAAAA